MSQSKWWSSTRSYSGRCRRVRKGSAVPEVLLWAPGVRRGAGGGTRVGGGGVRLPDSRVCGVILGPDFGEGDHSKASRSQEDLALELSVGLLRTAAGAVLVTPEAPGLLPARAPRTASEGCRVLRPALYGSSEKAAELPQETKKSAEPRLLLKERHTHPWGRGVLGRPSPVVSGRRCPSAGRGAQG